MVATSVVAIVGVLGVVHLLAFYGGRPAIAGVVKAIPVLLLAEVVARGAADPALGRRIAVGLVLSALGDVSLVFRGGFLAGLSAFFVAHCCYIAAFAPGAVVNGASAFAGTALAAMALGMLVYLWPHVARLRPPVVVYVGALSLMAWCAIARATALGAGAAEHAGAVGALVFLVSDGVLAVDRFARPFAAAHAVVMTTYYTAQVLIARSAL
jgi:uncharacterized membrane protein YhhN